MHHRVRGRKVKFGDLYQTKAEAIAAFERQCQRKGIAPPFHYPPGASGDSITTTNDLAYPRSTCAAGLREGHGWVYVKARNDAGVELRRSSAGLGVSVWPLDAAY